MPPTTAYTVARALAIARGLQEMADAARHLLTIADQVNLILTDLDQTRALTESQYNTLNALATNWRQRADTIHRRILSDATEP